MRNAGENPTITFFESAPAPVLQFGSLPGAVLSGSAQKVPKDAAWRGVEYLASVCGARQKLRPKACFLPTAAHAYAPLFLPLAARSNAAPPRPPQARTVVFAVLHFLLPGGLQLKQLLSFQEQGTDRFLKCNSSVNRNLLKKG